MDSLAERGHWSGPTNEAAEPLRAGLRRAANRAGIHIRTGIAQDGRVWASTPDGLPALEPWRGAAAHLLDSGAEDAAALDALERATRQAQTRPSKE